MITGLDHVVVALNDIEAGVATYQVLLGRAPSWRSRGEGSQTVLFTLDNMSLELMAPSGESATGFFVARAPEGIAVRVVLRPVRDRRRDILAGAAGGAAQWRRGGRDRA